MIERRNDRHFSRWLKCFVVLYLCLMGMVAVHAATYRQSHIEASANKVLICTSPKAYAYHSHYCHGLKRCTYDIVTTTRSEAMKRGYQACKICYK